MAAEGSECSGDINQIFPAAGPAAGAAPAAGYRFFNQPIEQIPGYNGDKPQILVHRPNCGLQWFTLDQCLPVVTCLDLQSDKLKVERRSVVVIKDFEIPNDTECDIDITDCESEA